MDGGGSATERLAQLGERARAGGGENLRVVVRVRPPLEQERGSSSRPYQESVLAQPEANTVLIAEDVDAALRQGDPAAHRFTFDGVYGQESQQHELYSASARDAVFSTLNGFNASMIAYGQTGTGKTFTMEGQRSSMDSYSSIIHRNPSALEASAEGDKVASERGIIPRAIEDIFSHIESDSGPETQYLVRASYLQIYNEVISDLLKPDRSNLAIREDKRRGLFVEGLSEWVVRSPAEIYGLMERGAAQRATGSTKLNEVSSRSHGVFQIVIERSADEIVDGAVHDIPAPERSADENGHAEDSKQNPRKQRRLCIGKLNLVDLAGSERVRVSRATGKRLEESKKINQSLSSLGNVISALTDSKSRTHIPYRDSKLTRILEDSLGGNCKTTMFAMVSPSLECFGESLSTLKFAHRAKHIKNNARINEDFDQTSLLRWYERRIYELQSQLGETDKQVVDKRKLVEVQEQKEREEQNKLKALTRLDHISQEFMKEKNEKRQLEGQIQKLQSQLLGGGQQIEETPAFRERLAQEQERIRKEFEGRVKELEEERMAANDDKQKVTRYHQVLTKQRDIMTALTSRLNERDERIKSLQEELDAYDKEFKELQDELDSKKAELVTLRKKAAMAEASPDQSPALHDELQLQSSDRTPSAAQAPMLAQPEAEEVDMETIEAGGGLEHQQMHREQHDKAETLDDGAQRLWTLAMSNDTKAFQKAVNEYRKGFESSQNPNLKKWLDELRSEHRVLQDGLARELDTYKKENSHLRQRVEELQGEGDEAQTPRIEPAPEEQMRKAVDDVLPKRERKAVREIISGQLRSIVNDTKSTLSSMPNEKNSEDVRKQLDKLDTICSKTADFLSVEVGRNRHWE